MHILLQVLLVVLGAFVAMAIVGVVLIIGTTILAGTAYAGIGVFLLFQKCCNYCNNKEEIVPLLADEYDL